MDQLAGLGAQFGVPSLQGSMALGNVSEPMMPPEMEMAVQQLVEQYGMSPEQAMELVMSQAEQDPMSTPQGVLGGQPPQLSQQDFAMLAQQFGLAPGGVGGEDPAYDPNYDITAILGGAYGYES